MEHELKHLNMTVVNIDDILVFGKTEENHVTNLTAIIDKFSEPGLTLNDIKGQFLKKSVDFVGFILSEHGLQTNPEKVQL